MHLKLCACALVFACVSQATLIRLEVKQTDVPDDPSFSRIGSYERLTGKTYFAVDPRSPANRIVRDLDRAPLNANGLVEFSADVIIVRPRDPSRSNGAVLFEASNRGSAGNFGFFNRSVGPDGRRTNHEFGDCFLLEQGYTLVWLGWQFDVPRQPHLIRLYPPIAKGIKGLVRSEITVQKKEVLRSLADRNHTAYPVLNPDDPAITLTVRDRALGPRRTIPRSQWRVVDRTNVELQSGFEPGRLYELIYTAQDPPIAGLGAAGIRDMIAYLKHDEPGRRVDRAYAFGQSQSARYLRNFIYDGFNADERARRVFDGMLVHVAGAGRGSFNVRFAQPSRDGAPFYNVFYPTDIFPFTDVEQADPVTGLADGILPHATASATVPKIFYMNSSYEYYGRAASLIHTTIDGREDAPIPTTTRIYLFSAGQHGPGGYPPQAQETQYAANPNPFPWCLRALLVAMDKWVRDGVEPPASEYPRLARADLVPLTKLRFPRIPGVRLPDRFQTAYRVDYGPDFRSRGIISIEPPKIGAPFPILVPQVDNDGNDIAGIRMPGIQVPLATYTGWNLRAFSIGAPDEMAHLIGSYFRFPATKADRERAGDPRLSIDERYANREEYLTKAAAAGRSLVDRRFILERDLARLVDYAAAEWDFVTSRSK